MLSRLCRTCQVAARPGLAVARHPDGSNPPLPVVDQANAVAVALAAEIEVERREADVVVIGGGDSGRRALAEATEAGREAVMLDAADGNDVVAVYPGRPSSPELLGGCSMSMPRRSWSRRERPISSRSAPGTTCRG